eukprot:m.111642 g.111642  ORF g.111642 m.111642 type:complete len:141 (+) comp12767_c2_seq3:235-657(+)
MQSRLILSYINKNNTINTVNMGKGWISWKGMNQQKLQTKSFTTITTATTTTIRRRDRKENFLMACITKGMRQDQRPNHQRTPTTTTTATATHYSHRSKMKKEVFGTESTNHKKEQREGTTHNSIQSVSNIDITEFQLKRK